MRVKCSNVVDVASEKGAGVSQRTSTHTHTHTHAHMTEAAFSHPRLTLHDRTSVQLVTSTFLCPRRTPLTLTHLASANNTNPSLSRATPSTICTVTGTDGSALGSRIYTGLTPNGVSKLLNADGWIGASCESPYTTSFLSGPLRPFLCPVLSTNTFPLHTPFAGMKECSQSVRLLPPLALAHTLPLIGVSRSSVTAPPAYLLLRHAHLAV
jgi:hypothetical protein